MSSLLFLSLLDQPALLRQLPGLRVAGGRRAPDTAHAAADWLDLEPTEPSALLRWAAESAGAPPAAWLACMDPVSVAADLRELHLVDPAPGLTAPEAEALATTIRASLEERGLTLHRPRSDRWYVSSARPLVFYAAAPAVVSAGRLRDELPAGPDAARVTALCNDIQMLWHDHPVNRERAARGRAPVNSVWIWGGGSAGRDARPDDPPPPLFSADPLLRGLWSRLGGTVHEQPAPDRIPMLLGERCVASLDEPDLPAALARSLSGVPALRLVTRDGRAADVPGSWLSRLWPWRRRG